MACSPSGSRAVAPSSPGMDESLGSLWALWTQNTSACTSFAQCMMCVIENAFQGKHHLQENCALILVLCAQWPISHAATRRKKVR